MYSPSIEKLIKIFSRFPTVGPRTASRFVFYLLKLKKEEIKEILDSIELLQKNVKHCQLCFNFFEEEGRARQGQGVHFCPVCSNPGRDKSLLCLVEKETDLNSIEKTKKYRGLYFILGGILPRLKKESPEKLRIKELENRLKKSPEIKEIILAFNFTPEGESTALYLERLIKPLNKKISRLGRGLPVGSELEYADEETLSSALEGRK